MSNQPTDPQADDESLDDLDVPAEQSDAVTGGTDRGEPVEQAPQGNIQAI